MRILMLGLDAAGKTSTCVQRFVFKIIRLFCLLIFSSSLSLSVYVEAGGVGAGVKCSNRKCKHNLVRVCLCVQVST